jgi:hypothetical protein
VQRTRREKPALSPGGVAVTVEALMITLGIESRDARSLLLRFDGQP